MGKFKARELRSDASPEEVRRQLNEIQKEIAADLAALSAARTVTELKTKGYAARYGDVVRVAPPAGGLRVILPPVNPAQPNGRVTVVVESILGQLSVEAVGTTVDGAAVETFAVGRGTIEFRLTPSGWYSHTRPRLSGVWHVDNFGAVPVQFGTAEPTGSALTALRAANVRAIQAALDRALASGGGTVFVGPGVYLTDGPVGYNLAADINVDVTVQGLGPFGASMIKCSSTTLPAFWLHTTTGNIRNVYVKDLTILGGLTGLSMVRCNYSRFYDLFFWGSHQYALQSYLGSENVFLSPYFTESAATLGGDAYIGINSADELVNGSFGEACGGIVSLGGTLLIRGGVGYGCQFQGQDYTDYWTTPGTPINETMAYFSGETAGIIVSGGDAMIDDLRWSLGKKFLRIDGAYNVSIADCYVSSGDSSSGGSGILQGMIDIPTNPSARLALSINGGQYCFRSGDTGYFIQEAPGVLHDSVITTQLIVESGATLTALSVSAPALLNPGTENNLVQIRTFAR